MTTAAPAPWAAFDEKLRKRFAGEQQRFELAELSRPGQSDEAYRAALKICDKADEELRGMQKHLAELQARLDAATAEHAATCEPLQAKLAQDGLTPAQRVEARASINSANCKLEETTNEIRPLLEAADREFQLLRQRASIRQQVENAFCASGSPEQTERLAILRKCETLVSQRLLFELDRSARHGDPITRGVATICHGFRRQILDEQDAIRQARLRQLYDVDG